MRRIQVRTGPYSICIEAGLLSRVPELLEEVYGCRRPRLAIVTDNIVEGLYGRDLLASLTQAGHTAVLYAFPNGEASKTLETVSHVYSFLSENGITRSDVILALGGGVVGDLAGFAAATWLRGIDFVQLPTTLLAMVDSSVGGKTGVDLPQGKNLAGAFWQPRMVICDPAALNTLPETILCDGVAEAIKCGAILDESLFAQLESRDLSAHVEEVISRCVDLKRLVVEEDERDTGMRQLLNFGHTLGHAIEKESGFAVPHGRAVAMGMVILTKITEQHGLTPAGTAARIADCCARYGLPTDSPYPLETLCVHCMGDKKRAGASLMLVILERLGHAVLYPVKAEELSSFVHKGADVCPTC